MNRKKFERYLTGSGCAFYRHGTGHDLWRSVGNNYSTSIPRHKEIDPGMIKAICKQLNIPPPPEK
jgi:predicted RNA binding protein YcfA (HicA-like mRNA interferase family)